MGQPLPKAYHPTAPMAPAFNAGLTGAGVGLFISAIQNSLQTHNKGAMGVFTRTGWMIGYFGEPFPSPRGRCHEKSAVGYLDKRDPPR